jgi:hypothetical protein
MFVPKIALHAMMAFVRHILDESEAQALFRLFESTEEEIMRIYAEAIDDTDSLAES